MTASLLRELHQLLLIRSCYTSLFARYADNIQIFIVKKVKKQKETYAAESGRKEQSH